MDLSEPSAAICPSLDGPVLMVLAGTTLPLSARAIARLVRRGSVGGVNKTLQRLTAHGIVIARSAQPSILYILNREHLAAPAVALLADLRTELVGRISSAISLWKVPPDFASLFGSAARGDGNTESDIDLLFVRPIGVELDERTWAFQVQRLASDVHHWTGNHASVIEISAEELQGPGAQNLERFVSSVREDWIILYGSVPVELEPSK
jgi:hypothetical protein